MDIKLLLCFIMISPILGDNHYPNPQSIIEADKARSAWNFGGGSGYSSPAVTRKTTLTQWGRQRSTIPGSVVANRRQSTHHKSSSRNKKKATGNRSPALIMHQRPYQKLVKGHHGKVTKATQQPSSAKVKSLPISSTPQQSYYPHPFFNKQQQKPQQQQLFSNPTWTRGSRMLVPKADNILSKFRKEDLWHLDKGEGYALKNEDLLYDHLQRSYKGLTSNSIEEEEEEKQKHFIKPEKLNENQQTHHHKELEHDAEKLINSAEDVVCNKNHQTGEDNAPNHIHHHHHYSNNMEKAKEQKKPANPNRPRSHSACLISIPGTPNLLKRRRRSADNPTENQQSLPVGTQTQLPAQPMAESRISQNPTGSRKHYTAHIVGNGKNPLPKPPINSNFKVPATIIAPPSFEKSDLLSMLMGSSGVDPTNMGTILATNTRYVRFGRDLPNREIRKGRKIQWFPDTSNNYLHNSVKSPSISQQAMPASASVMSQQQPIASSSNYAPSMVKYLPPPSSSSNQIMMNQRPASASSQVLQQAPQPSANILSQNPSVPQKYSAIPPPQYPTSNSATPQLPLVLNVQFAPAGSRPQSGGRVINVPVPASSQPQAAAQAPPPPSMPYQIIPVNTYQASNGDGFKYSEFWKPVYNYKEKAKPQKPFNYETYNAPRYSGEGIVSSESKVQYKKVKPTQEPEAVEESYENQEASNQNLIDTVTDALSPVPEYRDNNIQDSQQGAQSQNWENNSHIKTFAFALKKNNNKNSNSNAFGYDAPSSSLLSSFSSDMTTADSHDSIDELAAYTSSESELDSTADSQQEQYQDNQSFNSYDNNNFDLQEAENSRAYQNSNQDYYYSLVKKITGDIPEPIYISIPKEDDGYYNEIKK